MKQTNKVDGAGISGVMFSVFAWQAGLIIQKSMAPDTNAGSLMLIQVGSSAVLMWLVLLLAGKLPPLSRQTTFNIMWGMMAPGLVFAFSIAGAARTNGISVALLWGFLPLLGPFLARILLREPLHWTFPAGGLIGIVGLVLMQSGGNGDGASNLIGNLLVLASVICAAMSSVIARFFNRGRSTWFVSATLQLTGATVTGIMIVLISGWRPPPVNSLETSLSMAYLVLVMTILNYVAFNFALSRVTVSWMGLISACGPVVGLFMAWAFTGARVGPAELTAAAIIISGVALPYLYKLAYSSRMARE